MNILTRFFGFILFVMLLGVAACSTDFEVNAPYTEKTVIYAMLDAADTVQTVRILKTFLNSNGQNAYDLTKNPDSCLYAEGVLKVDLYLINPITKQEIWKDSLHRVVLPDARRSDGDFFMTPNVVYQTSKGFKLQTSISNAPTIYKIKVTNRRTGHVATAQTEILGDFSVETYSFWTNLPTVDFVRNNPSYAYSVDVISHLVETTNGVPTPLTLIWSGLSNQPISVSYGFVESKRMGSNRYQYMDYLLENINTANDQLSTTRRYESVDYRIRVVNQEFANYLSISGNFFDLTQSQPIVTNVTGGLGIFTSRYTKKFTFTPTNINLSSLFADKTSKYYILKIQ